MTTTVKYPSGGVVSYVPNALGQPTQAGNYATNVKYYTNGQIKSFEYGNGITHNVTLDNTYRIESITDSQPNLVISKLDFGYDLNDNLKEQRDFQNSNFDLLNMEYDGAGRLTSVNGAWGRGDYEYDGLGNITNRFFDDSTMTYEYINNRLSFNGGDYNYVYSYDNRGNVINNGRFDMLYNRANQMIAADGVEYKYDGHNRLVKKSASGESSYTVYSNMSGLLMHRVNSEKLETDSIYLGNQIIAEVDTEYTQPEPEIDPFIYASYVDEDGCLSFGCFDLLSGEEFEPLSEEYSGFEVFVISWEGIFADTCTVELTTENSWISSENGYQEIFATSGVIILSGIGDAEHELIFECSNSQGTAIEIIELNENNLYDYGIF